MASAKSGRSRPFAFVLMPFQPQFDDVYHLAIKPACEAAMIYCERVDEQIFTGPIMERIYNEIREADLVISDLTGRNPNVFYETGLAHAMGKEVVLLTQDLTDIPFDLKQYPHVGYGSKLGSLRQELQARLKMLITNEPGTRGARTPSSRPEIASRVPAVPKPRRSRKASRAQPQDDSVRNQLFISYSHRDIKWLKRLQIHLRPLERDNQVRRWDDTMLDPGDQWREKIREAVSIAKVAVLLISADFIASEFVHTNELPPLLAAAESEGAEILPIIVSPSRFEQIKRLSRFQAFNPPSKPLINMTRTQQEQLFVNVTCRIEDVLARFTAG